MILMTLQIMKEREPQLPVSCSQTEIKELGLC